MLKLFVLDNKDCKKRKIAVHSIGHTTTDYCIGVSALVQSLAAYLLGLEHDHPDQLYVEAKVGDGEYKVAAMSVDCWDEKLHQKLAGAIEMLTTGVINYATSAGSDKINGIASDNTDEYVAWHKVNQTGQTLHEVSGKHVALEKLTFEPWDNFN